MRALIVLVHYFAAEANPGHASVDGARRAERAAVVERVIRAYREHFGRSASIQFRPAAYVTRPDNELTIDIRVLSVDSACLVTDAVRQRYGVSRTNAVLDNPRMLGFCAHQLFAKFAGQYDWYLYSEDDLLVTDPMMFDKLAWFNTTFGDGCMLSPNRFELNANGPAPKTYIDGGQREASTARFHGYVPGSPELRAAPLGRELVFRRATNPHSGFAAITKSQLAHWMAQPHWLDHDVSFVSPLESAAGLGLAKTFAIYKGDPHSAGFFEVEHLDNRHSGFKWPLIDSALAEVPLV